MSWVALSPTATLLEHALLAQGFMGISKVAFPRRLQLPNRDSTGAKLSNAIKCRCRVIRGTHEERRDKALQDRFNRLGIHDERLRLKILGSLTSDEEEQIDQLVSEADGQQLPLIDSILQNAKKEQEEMNEHLRNLQHDIQAQ